MITAIVILYIIIAIAMAFYFMVNAGEHVYRKISAIITMSVLWPATMIAFLLLKVFK